MENTNLSLTEILQAWESKQITPKTLANLLVWGGFVNMGDWFEVYTTAKLEEDLMKLSEIKKQTSVMMSA
jgi:hypothetical protein